MTLAVGLSDDAVIIVELGAIILGLAVLARVAERAGISPIPLYLVAGLFFGQGGIVTPGFTEDFIELGAEIGVILLLLTLGLEYSAHELRTGLRTGARTGLVDVALNASPGAVVGVLLGFEPAETLLLAGITYISSSGIVAKLLRDLDRLGNRETPWILSVLVIEDLAMAAYLPVAAALIAGQSVPAAIVTATVAVAVVVAVIVVATRHGAVVNRALHAESDEALLLGVMGVTLLAAGLSQRMQVSAAVGAFLVGIALSGVVQERATALTSPLRDLFAAIFFLFFGLRIDPADLWPMLFPAVALALVTGATKYWTGVFGSRRHGIGRRGQRRAGTALVARGEFSIVIAGLGTVAGADPRLASLAAAYVLLLATAGPLLTRWADRR